MPIKFDLEEIRRKFECNYFFETGLYMGKGSKVALECKFEKCFCIEIRKDLVENGKEVFHEEIKEGRYHIYHDDSSNIKKYIKNDVFEKGRTIFFLDAHVDNSNIKNFIRRCPLFDELEAIKSLERNDHIILIDDLRILSKPNPWGETNYGEINYVENLKKQLLQINKEYKFDLLNGHIEDDVLMAWV
jgi:hypothetical protein